MNKYYKAVKDNSLRDGHDKGARLWYGQGRYQRGAQEAEAPSLRQVKGKKKIKYWLILIIFFEYLW